MARKSAAETAPCPALECQRILIGLVIFVLLNVFVENKYSLSLMSL